MKAITFSGTMVVRDGTETWFMDSLERLFDQWALPGSAMQCGADDSENTAISREIAEEWQSWEGSPSLSDFVQALNGNG